MINRNEIDDFGAQPLPTMGDDFGAQPLPQAQPQEGMLQRLAAYPGRLAEEVRGAPIGQSVATALGGLSRGAQKAAFEFAPSAIRAVYPGSELIERGAASFLGRGPSLPASEAIEQLQPVGQFPGETPEQMPYLAGAAEMTPEIAAYASSIPALAKVGAAGLRGAIGAIEKAPEFAMGVAEKIPGVRTLAGANVTKATRKGEEAIVESKNALNKAADKVYADYYDTPDYKKLVGQENKLIGDANLKNYRTQKEIAVKKYGEVASESGNKKVNIDSQIDSFINNDQYNVVAKKDSALDKKIKAYQDNKTFNSAHELQSQLGKRKAREIGKREPDWDIVDYLEKAQKSIVKDITPVGGEKYKDATRHWRQNVVPYEDIPAFNKLVKKGDVRANFSNLLTKSELETGGKNQLKSIDRIVSHMSPEQKEKVLLSHIVGSPGSPAINALGEINPSITLNKMQGLQMKGMSPFMTKDTTKYIKELDRLTKDIGKKENALAKEIKKQESISKYARYGAGGALGLEAIRRGR